MTIINISYNTHDLIKQTLLIIFSCLIAALYYKTCKRKNRPKYYNSCKRKNRSKVNDCNLKEILDKKYKFSKVNFGLHIEESSDFCIPIQTIDLQGAYVSIHAMGMLANKVVELKVLIKKDFILTPFYTDELEQGGGLEISSPHDQDDVLGYSQRYSYHMPSIQNGVVFCIDSEGGNAFVNALADFFCYTIPKHNNQTLHNLCFDALQLEMFSLQDNYLEYLDYNIVEAENFVNFNSPDTIREIFPLDDVTDITDRTSQTNLVHLKLLYTQKQDYYSEIYLNIDMDNKFLIFREKDPEYTENLINSFFQAPSF